MSEQSTVAGWHTTSVIMIGTGAGMIEIATGITTVPIEYAGKSWRSSGDGMGVIMRLSEQSAGTGMIGAVLITGTITPGIDIGAMTVGD